MQSILFNWFHEKCGIAARCISKECFLVTMNSFHEKIQIWRFFTLLVSLISRKNWKKYVHFAYFYYALYNWFDEKIETNFCKEGLSLICCNQWKNDIISTQSFFRTVCSRLYSVKKRKFSLVHRFQHYKVKNVYFPTKNSQKWLWILTRGMVTIFDPPKGLNK